MNTDSQINRESSTPPQTPSILCPSKTERRWAAFAHLSALSPLLGIPLGNIIDPLLIWWFKKEQLPFVSEQGKAALNFNLSIILYGLGVGLLGFVGILLGGSGWIVAGLYFFLSFLWLLCIVVAFFKTLFGKQFHYPLALTFF